jgi:outer membrane protein TolC
VSAGTEALSVDDDFGFARCLRARDREVASTAGSVLDTERTQLSAEDSLESSKAEGAQALVRLYKALGGGWALEVGATARAQSEES